MLSFSSIPRMTVSVSATLLNVLAKLVYSSEVSEKWSTGVTVVLTEDRAK